MHIGLTMFPTEYAIQPHDLAREAEARGFESLWLPEHSHIPTSRKSPWPGGGELPKPYYYSYDPFVSLAAAAALTKTIKLATGVCLVIQRDPIHTAKEVSTLDRLSSGRFLFGIGAGWNAEEMADHGTAFETRFKLMRERILAMKEIWTHEKAQFAGEFVKFDETFQWPKPVQKQHPPIIIGGGFPHAAKRAIAYGDGWVPIGGRLDPLQVLPQFRKMAKDAGRDPASLSFSLFGVARDPELLKRYRGAGVDRVVLQLPSKPREEILPMLDESAAFARGL
ncbi:MAG TPA: LLM class F420-dependent oxidoreductase [Xanthobacteraceae bacterium]|nr:LLM class F420-dependent oxidoreductase [Xanthobacteraceae bacterium]